MEAPNFPPHISPALALELLHTPPAPLPQGDPMLCGRAALLALRAQRTAAAGACANSSSTQAAAEGGGAGTARAAAAALTPPQTHEVPEPAAQARRGGMGHDALACGRSGDGGGGSIDSGSGGGGSGSVDGSRGGGGGGCGGGGGSRYRQLPSHNAADLSYDDFVRLYLAPNKPVVIRGITAGWRASSAWRTPEGRLRLGALQELAGACRVFVTDTRNQDDGCGDVRTVSLRDFLAWWRAHRCGDQQCGSGPAPDWEPDPGPDAGCGSDMDPARQGVLTPGAARPSPQALPPDGSGCGDGLAGAVSRRGEEPLGATAADMEAEAADGGGDGGGGSLPAAGLWYLKDWHFVAEFPQHGAYRLPTYFADDWLNAHYDALAAAAAVQRQGAEVIAAEGGGGGGEAAAAPQAPEAPPAEPATGAAAAAVTSDYRFCYLGPAGSWTPLHSDVLRSHSWSANVCGSKRWLMLAPEHTHLLYDRRGLRAAPHLEPWRVAGGGGGGGAGGGEEEAQEEEFPGLEEARAHAYEFVQESGDAVFVPSGWHHCVENLAHTLSLNHNWHNAHNAHWAWALLRRQYADAAAAIEDCRQLCPPDEFESLVQSNLAANMGMDWQGFVQLLECTVREALGTVRGSAAAARHGPEAAGLTLEAAEAAGPAIMTALLALERAGRILRDIISSFEELVLMPARKQLRGRTTDSDAWHRLEAASYIALARELLSAVEEKLKGYGSIVE